MYQGMQLSLIGEMKVVIADLLTPLKNLNCLAAQITHFIIPQ